MSELSHASPWWHTATVYQIYPRSFCDSNGDGIGDLGGIISKLDYLHALGISAIWLSPIFQSPMDDNGYDIADYQAVAPEFGTLENFDALVAEARRRGIGVILDLVVNHTSDAHRWFTEACASRQSPYRDYYIWRDPTPDGGAPNEMPSVFGGPAWTFHQPTGQYYFHQFSRRQPDLNWQNPKVRQDIYAMMNWWLARGIAGFRMDVIDLIGKDVDRGITAEGPLLHEYLQEMNRATFGDTSVLTVGESWSATPASALLYSGRDRHELSMVFQFEHVTQQWDPVHGKWRPKTLDLVALKAVLSKWQLALADDGWNSLFWGNHDLPRAVSRYGDVAGFHVQSAKLLAAVLHLLKGTPFIYQGEEIGMTNVPFTSIEQYRDIETLNMHRLHIDAGLSPADFIAGANANGRDNARTPMQWSTAPHGGFTSGIPWIEANSNFAHINVAGNMADENSILAHYRKLVGLRKNHPIIVYGRYQSYLDQHPQVFVFTRSLADQVLIVVANFSKEAASIDIPSELQRAGRPLIWNYEAVSSLADRYKAQPYEAFAMLC